MSAPLLDVRAVTKRFGGFTALEAVDLVLRPGERLGLIGPNGSGKTTLINCVSGAMRHDSGRILLDGADISGLPAHRRTRLGIARSFQIPRPFASMTVRENLCLSRDFAAAGGGRDGPGGEEPGAILRLLGLDAKAEVGAAALTQIELRKLELARALAAKPKLLISDEAMAGLSGAEVDDLLAILLTLNAGGLAIIMIEHIMQAVMRFSERILVLDAGRKIADGPPEAILRDPAVGRAYFGD